MTYQKYTTLEQSLKLLELGMEQTGFWHWTEPRDFVDGALEPSVVLDERTIEEFSVEPRCRAITRQELEDELRQRADVTIRTPVAYEGAVTGVHTVVEIDDAELDTPYTTIFESPKADPFELLYKALVMLLEQDATERTAAREPSDDPGEQKEQADFAQDDLPEPTA